MAELRTSGRRVDPRCDFFTVDTVWLRHLYVLVFLSVGSRRIEYVACTNNPNTAWMLQHVEQRGIEAGAHPAGLASAAIASMTIDKAP